MNTIDSLEKFAIATKAPGVKGRWSPLVLRLDPGAGEQLNVGVMFDDDRGGRFFRLLKNVAGVRCLYGADGASNAAFAIDQAAAALTRGLELPAGWSVGVGPSAFASGTSHDDVLERLFARVVPLARHELSEEDRLDADDHRLSTTRLRRRVRDIIKKRYDTRETPSFWRDSPVALSSTDGRAVSLDLQLWAESGTAVGVMGSIASAWYTSKFHRDSYLGTSYRALTEARQIAGQKAVAKLFLLRPFNDSRFTKDQLRDIDNEIDEVYWSLSKMGIGVDAFDNEETMASAVLAMC